MTQRSFNVLLSDRDAEVIGRALDVYLDQAELVDKDTAALAFMFSPNDLEQKAAERFAALMKVACESRR